jgi:hypothetical protein
MAANILNSRCAVEMSLFAVRAFVKVRAALAANEDLAQKLAILEQELKGGLDLHESAIVDVFQRLDEHPRPAARTGTAPAANGFPRQAGA